MSVNFEKIRGPRGNLRIEVPAIRYRTLGFGIDSPTANMWNQRIDAVRVVHGILQGDAMPASNDRLLQSLSIVKGLFSRVATGDKCEWFTVSRLLGHPSSILSNIASKRLAFVRAALIENKPTVFDEAVSRLYRDYIPEMLEYYLSMTVKASHPIVEESWAYILWSSSEPDALHIGAAGGTVEHVLGRLRREHPDNDAYGILATWLVHDAVDAYRDIHQALDEHALGEGFFRMNLGDAKFTVTRVLRRTNNLSHSPWHADQALPLSAPVDIGDGNFVLLP